jgi:hypothetical protein
MIDTILYWTIVVRQYLIYFLWSLFSANDKNFLGFGVGWTGGVFLIDLMVGWLHS